MQQGKIKQILVVQETREGVGRVALTPSAIASLPPEINHQIYM